MLLSSVILVLQEILEASLILSVLLAYSVRNKIPRRWAWLGIAAGIAAAGYYASIVAVVSEWFDYVGLEVVNASIQWTICLLLLIFGGLYMAGKTYPVRTYVWYGLMALIIALAIAREGFEILLYGLNFVGNDELWTPVLSGGLLGAGIGISIGALLYYGLISLPEKPGGKLLLILLALFGGNMAAQGTLLLVQADWLPSGQPLWDLSSLIPEGSLMGRLMYALIGYEATPTALQAGAYGLQVIIMLTLFSLRLPGVDQGD